MGTSTLTHATLPSILVTNGQFPTAGPAQSPSAKALPEPCGRTHPGQHQKSGHRGWTRKQKAMYAKCKAAFNIWMGHGFQCLFLTLTSCLRTHPGTLTYHAQMLRQRIERNLGFRGLQHIQVRTSEGHGVIHTVLAWRAPKGFRQRKFEIPRDWLAAQWEEIHGAARVNVQKVKPRQENTSKLTNYLARQEATSKGKGKKCRIERFSWSWGRIFGFPYVKTWSPWREAFYGPRGVNKEKAIKAWELLLQGKPLKVTGSGFTACLSLEQLRIRGPTWLRSVLALLTTDSLDVRVSPA